MSGGRSQRGLAGVRVVHIAPQLPLARSEHAGGKYQADVVQSILDQGGEVHVLCPAYASVIATRSTALPGITSSFPEHGPSSRSWRGRAIRAAHRANAVAARIPAPLPHPPFAAALMLDPTARERLRTADVIDLQWFESVALHRLVRRLAGPSPVIVGTHHDVISQRVRRTVARRRLSLWPALFARVERGLVRRLDRNVALSGKDCALLLSAGADPATLVLVPPAIASSQQRVPRDGAGAGRVLFVGYLARPENAEAVRWLIDEIMPRVWESEPDTVLHVVGGGAPAELTGAAGDDPRIVLRGFVDDLWSEYARAGCCVVPLRDGAGVKFKTLEALIAGVPTVATEIGAEGAGEPGDFAALAETPEELARGIVRALNDPDAAEQARKAGARVAALHGREAVAAAVRRAYGPRGDRSAA